MALYEIPLIFFTYSCGLIHITVDFSEVGGAGGGRGADLGTKFGSGISSQTKRPIYIKFGIQVGVRVTSLLTKL